MKKIFTLTLQLALTSALTLITHAVLSQGSNYALDFAGNNHLRVADDNSIDLSNSSITIEAWVNPASLTSAPVIAEKGSNTTSRYGFEILSDGTLCGYFSGSCDLISSIAVTANEWTHVALVFDNLSKEMTLYADGINVGSSVLGYNPSSDLGDLFIGRSGTINAANLDGQMDELRIWNSARSEIEIREDMCQKLNGSEPNLVAYFRMDEGIDNSCAGGEDVCDLTGNGNHGTKF